jgi:AraC-like DNA-binding protein/CheY-like chemotaxis protein
VADTGAGIPPDLRERVYEPFFSQDWSAQRPTGIGLGLSITRHLVGLHGGFLTLDSEPGQGSTFHVYLPLPVSDERVEEVIRPGEGALWVISHAEVPPAEIAAFAGRQGLPLYCLDLNEDIDALLTGGLPAAVAWDSSGRHEDDWQLIRRLHNHPQLSQTPFILYQGAGETGQTVGLTSLVVKPASSEALWEAIRPAVPRDGGGSVLIVDDDGHARQLAAEAVGKGLPGYDVRMAEDGQAGLSAILADPPDLVILDLMMPEMDGFEVLEHMREDEQARRVPVVILSGRQLSLDDVGRLERHAGVTLQSKAILSEDEIIATLRRTLAGEDVMPPQTGALAKRTLAYLHQHYDRPLSREEVAAGIGVNEDYLTRVFSREIGISPWDYLNRYRIFRAKELLIQTDKSISQIARQVGFSDPAYFSRVFRKLTGVSPSGYRKRPVA